MIADETDYEELAHTLTDPQRAAKTVGSPLRGDDAAAFGRALLVQDFGSDEALDRVLRKAGRPRAGADPQGPSPTVRGRVSSADFDALQRVVIRTGMTQSEIVREALHRFLVDEERSA